MQTVLCPQLLASVFLMIWWLVLFFPWYIRILNVLFVLRRPWWVNRMLKIQELAEWLPPPPTTPPQPDPYSPLCHVQTSFPLLSAGETPRRFDNTVCWIPPIWQTPAVTLTRSVMSPFCTCPLWRSWLAGITLNTWCVCVQSHREIHHLRFRGSLPVCVEGQPRVCQVHVGPTRPQWLLGSHQRCEHVFLTILICSFVVVFLFLDGDRHLFFFSILFFFLSFYFCACCSLFTYLWKFDKRVLLTVVYCLFGLNLSVSVFMLWGR